MPAGRPTKLTPELLDKAAGYLDYWEQESGLAVPQLVHLARYLGITSSTLFKWVAEDANPEFSDIVKEVMDVQHLKLVDGGLKQSFSGPITKLLLAKHGYTDKVESTVEHSGTVAQPELKVTVVAPNTEE